VLGRKTQAHHETRIEMSAKMVDTSSDSRGLYAEHLGEDAKYGFGRPIDVA
jgi:hypothetical protein